MHQVSCHAQDCERNREEGADGEEPPLARYFGLTGGGFGIEGVGCFVELDDAITGFFDGGFEIAVVQAAGQVAHIGAFVGQIDGGRKHAVNAVQRAFDIADAHGAGHAADGQVDAGGGDAIAGAFQARDERP